MESVSMRVTVPFCSFRNPYSREYLETEKLPPPSTVFGFLLSLVGEENRWEYAGTRLAIAIIQKPEITRILRTVWRVKSKNPPGTGNNKRPDYQEVLSDLVLGIWIAEGKLFERLLILKDNPKNITRYGGLSLGESRDMVNDVSFFSDIGESTGFWLKSDINGRYSLPIWVDHVGSKGTVWSQFSLDEAPLIAPSNEEDSRWIDIHGPRDK